MKNLTVILCLIVAGLTWSCNSSGNKSETPDSSKTQLPDSSKIKPRNNKNELTRVSVNYNGKKNDKNNLKFEWRGPKVSDGYSLIIFEIDEKQYSEIKNKKNTQIKIDKTLFQKSGIKENSFVFSDSSINFRENGRYGWGLRGGPWNGPWMLNPTELSLIDFQHMHTALDVVVWADNINDGLLSSEDGEDFQVISRDNKFWIRWLFPINYNLDDIMEMDNAWNGKPFSIKIVKVVYVPPGGGSGPS